MDLLNESDLLNTKVLSAISKMAMKSDNTAFTHRSPEVEAGEHTQGTTLHWLSLRPGRPIVVLDRPAA
ncbi:hypothetical protein AAXB25_29345 [Paenibacillus lautus]|uniref:hypothetical protein n=1 Tax=Paenibacillus lautus TaxID=1401 RepID=UPI003D2C9A6A